MSFTTAAVFGLTLYLFFWITRARGHGRNLDKIPTVGPSQPLLSYIGLIKFIFNATEVLKQGYERFKPGVFKVAGFSGWTVVVCGAKYVEELKKLPNDVVSFDEAASDVMQLPYTLGKDNILDSYHIHVLSSQLARNLRALFPDIHDEVNSALQDIIPSASEHEWAPMPAMDAMTEVMTRICNRVFVGLPLCRESEYVELCMKFVMTEVVHAALIIGIFPRVLRPLASHFLTRPSLRIDRVVELLEPFIAERRESMKNNGKDDPNRPNDYLQWLLMDSRGSQASDRELVARILAIGIAGIRTPSMTITHTLLHLAARPEYIQPLRQEIESIVSVEGWTKESIDKMHKLDSFIKETMRFSDTRFLSMMRKATKQFAFSDGTIIPAGTMLFAASYPTHFDPSIYPNAPEFDGFRFEKLRQPDNDDSGQRHQLTTANAEFLAWGYGRHVCPGRFFAGIEIKLILGYLIGNYEICLEQPGVRPPDFVVEANCMPNAQAKILLKRRHQ